MLRTLKIKQSCTSLVMAIAAAAVVALPFISVQPAAGQFNRATFTNFIEPEIARRDVGYLARELNLDQSQRAVVEALVSDYESQIRAKMGEFRDIIMEVQPTVFARQQQRMREMGEQMRGRIEEIREEIRERGLEMNSPEAREMFRERMREERTAMPDPQAMVADVLNDREVQRLLSVMSETVQQWESERRQLYEELVFDLRLQFNDDQQQKWPGIERDLRRMRLVPASQLSGEGVDLVLVLDEMRLEEHIREEIRPVVEQYKIELDEALQRREEVSSRNRNMLFDVIQKQDINMGLRLFDEEYRQRRAVRDVHELYVDLIAQALPQELGDDLRQRYLERGFGRVFQPTRADRLFRSAMRLDDLDGEKAALIESVYEDYQRGREDHDVRLVDTLRRYEAQQARQHIEVMASRFLGHQRDGGDSSDPISEAFDQRNEFDEQYVSMLRDMLTEEQFESLPGARQRQRRGEGWGGMIGGPGGRGMGEIQMRQRFERRRGDR